MTGIEAIEGTEKVVTEEEVKERRVVPLENLLLHCELHPVLLWLVGFT